MHPCRPAVACYVAGRSKISSADLTNLAGPGRVRRNRQAGLLEILLDECSSNHHHCNRYSEQQGSRENQQTAVLGWAGGCMQLESHGWLALETEKAGAGWDRAVPAMFYTTSTLPTISQKSRCLCVVWIPTG